MTQTPEQIAAGLTERWANDPNELHKRPPYRPHSFDNDGRYWVVGTTRTSILHGAHGSLEWAERISRLYNDTPAVRAILEKNNG